MNLLHHAGRGLPTLIMAVLFAAVISTSAIGTGAESSAVRGTTNVMSSGPSSAGTGPTLHNASAVAGVLRFVNGSGTPLPGASMRVLCYTSAGDTAPFADLQRATDGSGFPVPGMPGGCNYVAALQRVHTTLSGKPNHGPAYWVYATSWSPHAPALLPTTGNVTVTLANPLVLFNVFASLEWQPAANSPYVADVMAGLRSASSYLYSLTEGQMAIGPVTVQTGGQGWESSDLRFRAANDYRPSARMGGIVPAAIPYVASPTTSTVYVPGEILLGRYWDGSEASNPATGRWSLPNAYRTLMHEWGHYALFLYDEYQSTGMGGSSESYCTCSDLPSVSDVSNASVCGGATRAVAASAMAYQYTASKLWLAGTPSACMNTDQWLVHGKQDWHTLGEWSHIQGLPTEWLNVPAGVSAGPDLAIAGSLFGQMPGNRAYLPIVTSGGSTGSQVTQEPTISVTVNAVLTTTELLSLYPQVFITSPSQSRILYEGTTFGGRQSPNLVGHVTLLGVPKPDGRARIFIDQYATSLIPGRRYIYPPPGSADPMPTNGQTLQAVVDKWRSGMDMTYGMQGRLMTAMTVTLVSLDPLKVAPMAQLCAPDINQGCPANPLWRQAMAPSGSITWTVTFTAPAGTELPHYGVVDVQAAGVGELMRPYLASGGVGPAHIDGNAPLLDGLVTVEAVQPVPGASNQVIVMPAANYSALTTRLPDTVHGIVGLPLDVQVLLPGEAPLGVASTPRQAPAAPSAAPTADFSAFPTAGVAPLGVSFTDLSTDDPSSVLWDFGDGFRSEIKNPVHTYNKPGIYDVTLTVSGQSGGDTVTKRGYIRVRQPGTFVITLFYDPATLKRLGISPAQLLVLHFDKQTRQWGILQGTSLSRSGALNWLATPPVDAGGIYALGWFGLP